MASVPHGMENVATCQGCACQISVNLTQATVIWEEETSTEKKAAILWAGIHSLKKWLMWEDCQL